MTNNQMNGIETKHTERLGKNFCYGEFIDPSGTNYLIYNDNAFYKSHDEKKPIVKISHKKIILYEKLCIDNGTETFWTEAIHLRNITNPIELSIIKNLIANSEYKSLSETIDFIRDALKIEVSEKNELIGIYGEFIAAIYLKQKNINFEFASDPQSVHDLIVNPSNITAKKTVEIKTTTKQENAPVIKFKQASEKPDCYCFVTLMAGKDSIWEIWKDHPDIPAVLIDKMRKKYADNSLINYFINFTESINSVCFYYANQIQFFNQELGKLLDKFPFVRSCNYKIDLQQLNFQKISPDDFLVKKH